MAATKSGPAAPYTEAEVMDALLAVVANGGNAVAAVRSLEARGKRTPCSQTLRDWLRYTHAGLYQDLRDKHAEEIERQLVHEYRDVVTQSVEATKLAIQSATTALESGFDKEPSKTAANLATVADKFTRDMLTLQGKPTSIREDRSVNEILRSLAARGVLEMAEEPAQIEQETGERAE